MTTFTCIWDLRLKEVTAKDRDTARDMCNKLFARYKRFKGDGSDFVIVIAQ